MDTRLENLSEAEIYDLEIEGYSCLPKLSKSLEKKLEPYKDHVECLEDLYEIYTKNME